MLSRDLIQRHFQTEIDGYQYLSEIIIYIPYYRVDIETLERTEISLSFIHETILRLVSYGIDNLAEISEWLGLDERISAEIVSDMASEHKTLYTSKSSISLTPAGQNALTQLKNVVYKKSEMRGLYIDGVTSEIFGTSPRSWTDRIPVPHPALSTRIDVNVEMLNSNFAIIKDIYNEMKDSYLPEGIQEISLHRILGINRQEIVYSPERAGLYIHCENKNFLIVYKDIQKEIYSAATHQQMQQKTPEIKWLYDYDKSNMRNWDRPCWNRKNENIALAKMTDCYRLMEKNEASLAEFDAAYFCDRTLLSGEVEDLLSAINYFKPKRIAIISSHILKYLTNNVIRQELIDSLNKTEVIICYPKVDLKYQSQKIKDEIDYIKRSVPNGSREQIKFFELEDHCDRTVIICDPGFVIGITYNYIADSEGDMYLQEYGAVYFSPTTVTHISSLIEEYVQQHLVVEASGKR